MYIYIYILEPRTRALRARELRFLRIRQPRDCQTLRDIPQALYSQSVFFVLPSNINNINTNNYITITGHMLPKQSRKYLTLDAAGADMVRQTECS